MMMILLTITWKSCWKHLLITLQKQIRKHVYALHVKQWQTLNIVDRCNYLCWVWRQRFQKPILAKYAYKTIIHLQAYSMWMRQKKPYHRWITNVITRHIKYLYLAHSKIFKISSFFHLCMIRWVGLITIHRMKMPFCRFESVLGYYLFYLRSCSSAIPFFM